jgi:hypothetical protein
MCIANNILGCSTPITVVFYGGDGDGRRTLLQFFFIAAAEKLFPVIVTLVLCRNFKLPSLYHYCSRSVVIEETAQTWEGSLTNILYDHHLFSAVCVHN